MVRRAATSYSFLVGINKPAGISSHDVVNRLRRIYGEKRIGHTGTLDPAATGALLVCVGPATRLDKFLVGHTKDYEFSVVFGTQTSTDDAQGEVIAREVVSKKLCDYEFATESLRVLVGPSMQLPPAYSAIKINGQRAYNLARGGKEVALKPRPIEVFKLELINIDATNTDAPIWTLRTKVSSGTYVRSLARDLGNILGTCAHVEFLHRTKTGALDISECVSLETLESDPFAYILDPVKLLGFRFCFLEGSSALSVQNGAHLVQEKVQLFEYDAAALGYDNYCSCRSALQPSQESPRDGEIVCMIVENKLAALYTYLEKQGCYKSACGFSQGVVRGADI